MRECLAEQCDPLKSFGRDFSKTHCGPNGCWSGMGRAVLLGESQDMNCKRTVWTVCVAEPSRELDATKRRADDPEPTAPELSTFSVAPREPRFPLGRARAGRPRPRQLGGHRADGILKYGELGRPQWKPPSKALWLCKSSCGRMELRLGQRSTCMQVP